MALAATVAAAVAGQTVRAALLAELFCKSSTERIWPGNYTLQAAGYEWRGMSTFLSIDGLSIRVDLAAEALTFKLSGVDSRLVTIAKNSAEEVKGNACNVYIQFFDESWGQQLDKPVLLKSAIMDVMSYRAVGPDKREITLTAESIFVARNYSPYAYYTDRDQNARFPGDRGCEQIGALIYKAVTWPDF